MNPTPFSSQDQFTKDIAAIMQKMAAAETNPLPSELQAVVDTTKTQIASAKTSDEVSALMKAAASEASKKTGAVYTNQDLINFERQVRKGG